MKMVGIFLYGAALTTQAAQVVYTDRAAFLAEMTVQGYGIVNESFEDDVFSADGTVVVAADVHSQRVRTGPTSVWGARGLNSIGLPIQEQISQTALIDNELFRSLSHLR